MAVDVSDQDTKVMVDDTEFTGTAANKLIVPDMTDDQSVNDFLGQLSSNNGKQRVTGLLKLVSKCRRNTLLADKQLTRITQSVARLNGEHTPQERISNKSRSVQRAARRFYESLNTPNLRMQCVLFEIDYDAYDTQEDIIKDLVKKHVAMNT